MYIELKNINKSFGDFQASKDVNFAIEKGKLVGLLGPSGSGKTTILRMLAGLEHQDSGDICINGNVVNDLPSSQRGIGFVFQNYALFPYLTVYDNIAYGLKIQKKDKKFIKQRVTELLDLVGLPGLEKRYPDQLSGGQRQRIALARALAPNPEVGKIRIMNYRVVRIEEDVEFGCEERKEGDPVMAVVRLEDEDGDVKIVRQRDQMLYDRDINEGDRVWFDERQELVK